MYNYVSSQSSVLGCQQVMGCCWAHHLKHFAPIGTQFDFCNNADYVEFSGFGITFHWSLCLPACLVSSHFENRCDVNADDRCKMLVRWCNHNCKFGGPTWTKSRLATLNLESRLLPSSSPPHNVCGYKLVYKFVILFFDLPRNWAKTLGFLASTKDEATLVSMSCPRD